MTAPGPYYDWVSTKTIYIGGGRAFVPGSFVPDATASANGWDVDGTCVPAPVSPAPVPVTSVPMLITVGEVQ